MYISHDSVTLTGRGSALFHGSLLCHCPAGNMLRTLWWRSLHHCSSLNEKTKQQNQMKARSLRDLGDSWCDFSYWFDCSFISCFCSISLPFSLILLIISSSSFHFSSFLFVSLPIHQHVWFHSIRWLLSELILTVHSVRKMPHLLWLGVW